MRITSAFLAGLLFGGGLLLSRMTNPQNVLAFLNVAGAWNPALLYTMAAAVVAGAPAFWAARRSQRSWLGIPIDLPDRFRVSNSLIFGSAVFGVGWGLSGVCPGPAALLLTRANLGAITFAAALASGMWVTDTWIRRPPQVASRDPAKVAVG